MATTEAIDHLEAPRTTPVRVLPGLVVVLVIGWMAVRIGAKAPVVGAPVIALAIGAALAQIPHFPRAQARPGVRFGAATLLQIAVVLLGAQISLGEVASVGMSSLPVMIATLAACLTTAAVVGRLMKIDGELRTLIGVGTAICGASAIAAVSSVIKPKSTAVAYAISTIFFFNVAAVLIFPPLGHLLHLSQDSFGLFAGTAVNDTSSVAAVATAYGHAPTSHAVVLKLTRTLMIVPIAGFLGARSGKAHDGGLGRAAVRLVPPFLIGFIVMTCLHSAHVITGGPATEMVRLAGVLTAGAISAIGFQTDFAALRRSGIRPLLLGAVLWVTVSVTSLGMQALV